MGERRLTCVVLSIGLVGSMLAGACGSSRRPPASSAPAASESMLGDFVDDYGNRFAITATTWTQLPHGRLRIVRWNETAQYLIAQNDSGSRYAPGRWTRIDWVTLPDMAPFTWAFCLSAYDAPTMAAAESTTVARRDTPRTGCNGHPFSRMRRAS